MKLILTSKYFFLFLLLAVTIFGFCLRLYKFSSLIADWHSFRQVDTASVARNFIKNGITPLYPRYDDLSNIQSGKDNPQGWRMVEFPIYQITAAILVKIVPIMTIEQSLRLVSIVASCGSIFLIGILGRKVYSREFGLTAAFFYATLPYSVYYGRVILPEPLMVFFSLFCLFWLVLGVESKRGRQFLYVLTGAVFGSLAILTKPYAVFLLFPLIGFFLFFFRFSKVYVIQWFLFAVIIAVPILWWREWITQFPEGIPVYAWLFNEGNIRFKGAWFYWIFAERIAKLIFGYWGVAFLVFGAVARKKETYSFLLPLFAAGAALYVIIIARGNVQHDYYQIPLIPVLSLYAAKGANLLLTKMPDIGKVRSIVVMGVIFLFSASFSWYTVRGYYWINKPEIIEAGRQADRLLPKDAKVIAPYNGDTTFLYQTNRSGWPLGFDIDKKIAQGATHYVTVSPGDEDLETKELKEKYTVIALTQEYAIIDLTTPR